MRTFRTFRVKLATCKICKGKYQRRSLAHVTCSTECAITHVQKLKDKRLEQKAREIRKEIWERKEKLKTRSDYMKEAQSAFNRYIRERDKDKPCICCGLPLGAGEVGGQFDCGHYRSVGSAPHLRFDERNAHAQRKQCNRWGAGRAVDYRLGLIARIGIAAVEALEADQEPRKWSIEDLIEIRDKYRRRYRELAK